MKCENFTRFIHRHLPPGASAESFIAFCTFSLTVSVGNSLIFLFSYATALARLYAISGGERILVKGAIIKPFAELMEGRSAGVIIMAVAALYLLIQNYISFYQGSRSIYLMRRLPDPWDLLRRTAALPLCVFLLSAVLLFLLSVTYYCIYLNLTPAQCLPAAESVSFWQSIF